MQIFVQKSSFFACFLINHYVKGHLPRFFPEAGDGFVQRGELRRAEG